MHGVRRHSDGETRGWGLGLRTEDGLGVFGPRGAEAELAELLLGLVGEGV